MENLQAVTAREHFKLTYLSGLEETRRQRRNGQGQGHGRRRANIERQRQMFPSNNNSTLCSHLLIRPKKTAKKGLG